MTTITIGDYDLLDIFMNRVKFWTTDSDILKLYELYYEDLILSGCFELSEIDIMNIVDNDCINWLNYGTKEDLENNDVDEDRIVATFNGLYLYYA